MARGAESFEVSYLERDNDGLLIEKVPVDNPRYGHDVAWSEYEDAVLGITRPIMGDLDAYSVSYLINCAEAGDMSALQWAQLEANRPDLFIPEEEVQNA